MEVSKQTYGIDRNLSNSIDKALLNEHNLIVSPGDYLVDDDGVIGKVVDIRFNNNENLKEIESPDGSFRKRIYIVYEDYRHNKERTLEENYFHRYSVYRGDLDDLHSDAQKILAGEINPEDIKLSNDTSSTSLISFDKKTFVSMKEALVLKVQDMQSKMKVAQDMLERKLSDLQEVLKPMLEEVKRIGSIILTIELYLGIQEDVVLAVDGEEASDDIPIHLCQERLYMDEELGDPSSGGMDIDSAYKFFEYLNSYNSYYKCQNYELLLPFEKSVRIMRIRRDRKDYGNPWINMTMEDANRRTFLLIRNGKKVYCIETKMDFGEKLFPSEDELLQLQKKTYEETLNVISRNGRQMDDKYRGEIVDEKMKRATDTYKRNLMIIQGIIDRTEILGKLQGRVNLFSTDALKRDHIKFFYDADLQNVIGDGDKMFIEKIKEIRGQISLGDRVLFLGGGYRDRGEYRFKYQANWYPTGPGFGLYTIDEEDKGEKHRDLYIKYLPSDDVYDEVNREWRQRKKKLCYKVYTDELIPVDMFSHRDMAWIEKMFHDRRLRKHYLDYMISLKKLKEFKEKELESEYHFISLVERECGVDRLVAMDALHWWKTKNKYKRALSVDMDADIAKAFRMIKSYLKNHGKSKATV